MSDVVVRRTGKETAYGSCRMNCATGSTSLCDPVSSDILARSVRCEPKTVQV